MQSTQRQHKRRVCGTYGPQRLWNTWSKTIVIVDSALHSSIVTFLNSEIFSQRL